MQPPDAETIRRVAQDVLLRGDYRLESGSDSSAVAESLLVKALQWLLSLFQALANSLAFLGMLRYPAAALLVLVAAWLIYRIVRSFSRRVQGGQGSAQPPRDRSARVSNPEEFEALAATARGEGLFVEAVRWLLRAALLRLERTEKRKPRPGATNRELLRRYRSTPLGEPLQTLVDTVDVHWYGDRPAEEADFDRCQASYQQLNRALAERTVNPATAGTPTLERSSRAASAPG